MVIDIQELADSGEQPFLPLLDLASCPAHFIDGGTGLIIGYCELAETAAQILRDHSDLVGVRFKKTVQFLLSDFQNPDLVIRCNDSCRSGPGVQHCHFAENAAGAEFRQLLLLF